MLNRVHFSAATLLAAANTGFSWAQNRSQIIATGLLSMVPMFEGRYAVSVMLGMGMPMGFAYVLALVCSSIPIPIILLLLRPVLDWFYTLPIKPVRRFAAWVEKRGERKREKMHSGEGKGLRGWLRGRVSEDAMELIGLYVFVALPLPGTGVWTGSLVATLFAMPRLKSGIVILLGNMTACAIMTLATGGVISIL